MHCLLLSFIVIFCSFLTFELLLIYVFRLVMMTPKSFQYSNLFLEFDNLCASMKYSLLYLGVPSMKSGKMLYMSRQSTLVSYDLISEATANVILRNL